MRRMRQKLGLVLALIVAAAAIPVVARALLQPGFRLWRDDRILAAIPVGERTLLQQADPAASSILNDPYAPFKLTDTVTALQRKLDSGQVKLTYDAKHGYLRSLLEQLKIPESSQTLVFAKNSFQLHLIAPGRPRAMYFNDDNYVGWVQGASDLEVASVDPKAGPVFYTLAQEDTAHPKFHRQVDNCLVCHDSSGTKDPIPRVLMLSVLPDPEGNAIGRQSVITNDRSPFEERYGGWYVTGTHGNQRHLGNMIVQNPASAGDLKDYAARMNLSDNGNQTDLRTTFDTRPYLTPHSDLIALMILAHQTHVHNLITRGAYNVRQALQSEKPKGRSGEHSPETMQVLKDEGDAIVQSMLFAKSVSFSAPVAGTTSFAADFMNQGPKDSQGRSLRELDLKTRLFRYPLSYLIYTQSFDQMPDVLKQYVCRHIYGVLTGADASEDFQNLSPSDRKAILEILKETKPEFLAIASK